MLLAMAGLGLILIFMFIVMTKRMSAMVALIFIPVVFAVVLGFQPDALGKMMLDGIKKVAPTGIMIGFAMMYFSTMIDTGMFDPIIRTIQKATKGDPARIVLGSSVLATLVALDGDGATTYMVTCTAMLSFYKRLKLNPLILPTVALIPASIMNMTPWGGPTRTCDQCAPIRGSGYLSAINSSNDCWYFIYLGSCFLDGGKGEKANWLCGE